MSNRDILTLVFVGISAVLILAWLITIVQGP